MVHRPLREIVTDWLGAVKRSTTILRRVFPDLSATFGLLLTRVPLLLVDSSKSPCGCFCSALNA